MERHRTPRPAPRPTSITECARRYHACAVALAKTLGLSLADVLAQHRESVTAIFIEAGRCDLRVPASASLPPLAPATGQPEVSSASEKHASPPTNGQSVEPPDDPASGEIACTGRIPDPEATRLSQDQARELKRLAQTAFGYREGERRLRQDLGFEADEALTLRHLCAHVTAVQAQALLAAYAATLRAQGNGDVR